MKRSLVVLSILLGCASDCATLHPKTEHAELELAERSPSRAPGPHVTPGSEGSVVAAASTTAELSGGPTAQATSATHEVEKGETLFHIAQVNHVTVAALMAENHLRDASLAVGQRLRIPGAPRPRALVAPAAEPSEASRAERQDEPAPHVSSTPRVPSRPMRVELPTGEGRLEWPLRGIIYAPFGAKGHERHDGIDLAAPVGTPIAAAHPGTVLYAGEQKGYGLIAIIDHGGGLVTLYAHNRDLRVRTGQSVREHQVVATVGESGRTSSPHLHFEVRRDGLPVDPLTYLGAPPARLLGRRKP